MSGMNSDKGLIHMGREQLQVMIHITMLLQEEELISKEEQQAALRTLQEQFNKNE